MKKKMIMGMIAAAFAQVAFSDVTPALVSENLFGSIKVDTNSEFTMVAVPFEGFDSQFVDYEASNGAPVPNNILARDVIAVEKILPADTMSLHNPASTDDKEEFDNYIARKAKFKIGTTTYEYMEWLASMWFDEDTMTSNKFPDPDQRLVPVGTGVFIGRDSANARPFSIYAYGQIPQSFDYTAENELKKGKTILSPVGERAYSPVDINKLTWTGSFTEVAGTERSDARFFARYGVTNILTITSTPATADSVVYYDTENQEQKEFVRYGGRWVRKVNATMASLEDDALLPAGQAFWYLRKADSSAYMAWDMVEADEP